MALLWIRKYSEREQTMPLLNKKDEDLTLEEISDLQETLEFEEGFGRPKYQEVVDEDGYITYEYID